MIEAFSLRLSTRCTTRKVLVCLAKAAWNLQNAFCPIECKTNKNIQSGWRLTFSPLIPESPFRPGKPGGPCERENRVQRRQVLSKNSGNILSNIAQRPEVYSPVAQEVRLGLENQADLALPA